MKKLEKDYNFIDWWKKVVFENYANFEGRARRAEYWNNYLANILAYICLAVLMVIPIINYIAILAIGLYIFGVFVPSLAVTVRRLHDTGKSGWYILMSLIPFVGGIIVLVALVTEGEKGPNQYGSDPKNLTNEMNEIGKSPIEVN